MDANILGGDGSDPTGNEDIIDLSHDMVRNACDWSIAAARLTAS